MKVVHICPQFTDGWSYQENYLPKYQKRLGHDVSVIAANYAFDEKRELVRCDKSNYYNSDGIKIIRLRIKNDKQYDYKFRDFDNLIETLDSEMPDVLFVHSVQFVYIKSIVEYIKNHTHIKVFVDNHADFSNSATNPISKYILHGIVWKHYAKMIDPFVNKWFGVLPARVDFLINMYGLQRKKVELLVMGSDDDCIEKYNTPEYRHKYREKYGIKDDDFLIVTGGKIDLAKKQTLLLMDAVNNCRGKNIKLIVFGSVVPEMKSKIMERCSQNVQYIGWVDGDESYSHFVMGDVVTFPGRHSVYWEQVAGIGKPMICKSWPGTKHIDRGGNVIFLEEDSVEEITKAIETVIEKDKYNEMLKIAEKYSADFRYSRIAEQSIR